MLFGFGLVQDAPGVGGRGIGFGLLTFLAVEPGDLQFDIGDPRSIAAGAAFQHVERGGECPAGVAGAFQTVIDEAEIEQVVGDERVGRAEPGLVDRPRL